MNFGINNTAYLPRRLCTYGTKSERPIIETGPILELEVQRHTRTHTNILSSVTGRKKQDVMENAEEQKTKRKIKQNARMQTKLLTIPKGPFIRIIHHTGDIRKGGDEVNVATKFHVH